MVGDLGVGRDCRTATGEDMVVIVLKPAHWWQSSEARDGCARIKESLK